VANSVPSIACRSCGESALYDFERGTYRCARCVEARRTRTTALSSKALAPASGAAPAVAAPTGRDSPPAAPGLLPPEGPEVSLDELERRFGDQESSGEQVSVCQCQGCGAQVEIAATATLAQCPFCDRKAPVREGMSTVALQEPLVLPFIIDEQTAARAMERHLEELWLRPGSVSRALTRGEVRKVYVPFWAFDAQVNTEWSGSVDVWKEPGCLGSLLGKEGRYVTEPISGQRSQRVDDWLVCASHGIEPAVVRALEPFSTDRGPSGPALLAFGETPVEVVALGPRAAWQEAQTGLRRQEYRDSMAQALSQDKRASEERISLSGRVRFGPPMGKAVMLPLYVLSVQTARGRAQVVVNGETGRVASRVPYTYLKLVPAAVAGAAGIGAVLIATAGTAVPVLGGLFAWGWWSQRQKRKQIEASFLSG
jgi:hypothetical protein